MDPYETTVFPLTTVFTPPASCSSSWTYEGSYYNSVPGGILIQNALLHSTDSNCFPSGFTNAGRGTASDLLSPGYCPHGYTSPAIFQGGTATTAICCLSWVFPSCRVGGGVVRMNLAELTELTDRAETSYTHPPSPPFRA